ncbi:hypothetical protein [Anaerovorax odorimutans]|uniref:hypothetical protein n=1 Tax=Anaerovorax odorimutans TaxID=109327 RepID=UPI0004294491|nr:hypothetical protein [Anaerovorax odorimutans]
MGAVFFMMLMVILFCIAMFFIVVSTVFLIFRRVKKRKGKLVKKKWFVIPMVILVFNILVACIPIGYIVFLHIANSSQITDIVYAKSGEVLYWPIGEYESTTNWFEMDGKKYIQFREGFSEEPFFLCSTEAKRGEPVANISYDPATSNAFNDAMTFLLTGSSREKLSMSTIYPIVNENGFEFYEVSGNVGNDVFCQESKLDSIKAYYAEISNYETKKLTCEYSAYTEDEGNGERRHRPYINIEQDVTVNTEVFNELEQALESGQDLMSVEIPQKYIELEKAAQPDTPIFGYDERELLAYSKDHMAYRHVYLVLIDGQVYVEQGSSGNYITGYSLPDEMNRYIITTVFVN